jgi:hypothetical protein
MRRFAVVVLDDALFQIGRTPDIMLFSAGLPIGEDKRSAWHPAEGIMMAAISAARQP